MPECNHKGGWLCKGLATQCQCIPFLGLNKKQFHRRFKVACFEEVNLNFKVDRKNMLCLF